MVCHPGMAGLCRLLNRAQCQRRGHRGAMETLPRVVWVAQSDWDCGELAELSVVHVTPSC